MPRLMASSAISTTGIPTIPKMTATPRSRRLRAMTWAPVEGAMANGGGQIINEHLVAQQTVRSGGEMPSFSAECAKDAKDLRAFCSTEEGFCILEMEMLSIGSLH